MVNAYAKIEQDIIDEEAEKQKEEQEQEQEENETVKKSRPFDDLKPSTTETNTSQQTTQFNFDDEDNDYDYEAEVEDSNIRKQRLLSKENNSNKLVHIKSNGRQEVTSSPVPIETDGEIDATDSNSG